MKFLSVLTEETFTLVKFTNGKMFDETSISELGLELLEFVETTLEKKKVILDFTGVVYFSSAALGKMITMNKKLKEKEIILTLRNMNEDIHEVFVITRLDKFFKIEP
jgi:anti-sigma B factor antagonist